MENATVMLGRPDKTPNLTTGDLKSMVLLAEMFDHHMRAIGVIAVRWSSVDRLLYDILKDRLSLPDQAKALRRCNAGTSRLEFFNSRLRHSALHIKEQKFLADLANRLIVLCEERNSIIHGQYGVSADDDGGLFVIYGDIGMKKGQEDSCSCLEPALVCVEHLTQHADAVYEATMPLSKFLHHHI